MQNLEGSRLIEESRGEDEVHGIEDLSAFIIAGRVRSSPDRRSETAGRTPAQGVQDGVDAERIGFRRVFLSERWNLKEAGALLGGIAARTTRLEVGTGVISPPTRHPLHAAAFAATMHAAYGPRFVLGLGRGEGAALQAAGLEPFGYDGLIDYASILRRLWAGEKITYDGPAGRFAEMGLGDLYEGSAPQLWYGTLGMPRGAEVAARAFDGVLLTCCMTPTATQQAVQRLHTACERIGRDPATLHVAQCVITAPELGDEETRELVHARCLTYLQAPDFGRWLVRLNGWDPGVREQLLSHPLLRPDRGLIDHARHRAEMGELASLVPDEWMRESSAMGSAAECVATLQQFRDAGADELVTYGSTPGQNALLASLWRRSKLSTQTAPHRVTVT